MRHGCLWTLFVITCILIGLVELACKRLPAHNGLQQDPKKSHLRRQVIPVETGTPTTIITTGTVPGSDLLGVGDAPTQIASTAPGSDLLGVGDAPTTITPLPPSSDLLGVGDAPPQIASTAPGSDLLGVGDAPPPTTASFIASTDLLGVGDTPPTTAASAPGSVYLGNGSPTVTPTTSIPVTSTVMGLNGASTITSMSAITAASYSSLTSAPAITTFMSTSGSSVLIITSSLIPIGVNSSMFDNSTASGVTQLASKGQSTTSWSIKYFTGNFVPIITAVLFSFPFRMLDTSVRTMVPFYELHSSSGVAGPDLLNLDYTRTNIVITTILSLLSGHSMMIISSLLSIALIFLVPLSAEAIFLNLENCVQYPDAVYCTTSITVYPLIARVLQAVLGLIAVLLILLCYLLYRNNSGVYADPSSICGLATLMHNPPLVQIMSHMDLDISDRDFENAIQGKRLHLGAHNMPDGYGIFVTDEYGSVNVTTQPTPPTQNQPRKTWFSDLGKPTMKFFKVFSVYFVFSATLALFGMVVFYYKNSADNQFERFMDSQSFGPRFMMTAFGVLIKLFWETLLEGEL
jgi:hypothetical protein